MLKKKKIGRCRNPNYLCRLYEKYLWVLDFILWFICFLFAFFNPFGFVYECNSFFLDEYYYTETKWNYHKWPIKRLGRLFKIIYL